MKFVMVLFSIGHVLALREQELDTPNALLFFFREVPNRRCENVYTCHSTVKNVKTFFILHVYVRSSSTNSVGPRKRLNPQRFTPLITAGLVFYFQSVCVILFDIPRIKKKKTNNCTSL
jgi:hypothetical protein